MKVLLFSLLLVAACAVGQAQVLPLRADTVRIEKVGGNAVLQVRGTTRDSVGGIMTNVGGGAMQFKRSRAINDSMAVIGGDTIKVGGVPKNIANSSLNANGNYSHNWKGRNFYIDSIGNLSITAKGTLLGRPSVVKLLSNPSLPFTLNLSTNLRKLDNSADSIQNVLSSTGVDDISLTSSAPGVGASVRVTHGTTFSSVTIVSDSLRLKTRPAASADSILAIGPYNEVQQTNTVIKIPFAGGGGGETSVTGDTIIYLSRSPGIVSDANIDEGSTTFGTDNTTAVQSVLDIASHTRSINVIWDVKVSGNGWKIGPNTKISALPGKGAILRNGANKPLFINRDTVWGSEPIDSNIVIEGGIWNGNSYNAGSNPAQVVGTPENGLVNVFTFLGVRNVIVRDFQIIRQRIYAIYANNVKNALYENGVINGGEAAIFSDGVHFDGNSQHCTARNLKIKSGDDAVALNADDTFDNPSNPAYGFWPLNGSTSGPISDIRISNIFLDGGLFGVRIFSGASRIDDVIVNGLTGSTKGYAVVVDNYHQDTSVVIRSGVGNIGTIQIENVNVDIIGVPEVAISESVINLHCDIDKVILKDIKRNGYTHPSISTIRVNGAYTHIKSIVLDGYDAIDTATPGINHIFVHEGATIDDLNISRVNVIRTVGDGSGFLGNSGATITQLQVNNVRLDNVSYLYFNDGSTDKILATNINHNSTFTTFKTFNAGAAIDEITLSNYGGLSTNATGGTFTNKYGDAFATAQTLEIVTDNGSTTSNSMTINNSLSVAAGITLNGTPTPTDDINSIHGSSTATTVNFVAGPTGLLDGSGAFMGMRGTAYSALANQRGAVFFGAGNPSTPTGIEGCILFYTGAVAERMRITPGGNFLYNTTTDGGEKFQINGSVAIDLGGDATGDIYTRNSGGSVQAIAPGAAGSVLASNGTGALPAYQNVNNLLGYNKYTALISQAGTSAPSAAVLGANTIGAIVWTRFGTGVYIGTLTGAFAANKTWLSVTPSDEAGAIQSARAYWGSANSITLITKDAAGANADVFTNVSIEIRVYP